ncbi:hypothetical protein PQJ75_00850 [Rhodoplanes sp. TEM]|uniref:Uncharacterized protein n=1 Tax=Rhodoplanes tepidamans TaxID=200616 RepID=A0ABT5J577_RHOTP|nr:MULTISPECIES: hypothetical protein [Rhodoplanes]MDC7784801.1 hypothetical protein [Rhodoplanes tepidamans]MDC7982268.1 hypothetical protein [Rhodoplanes sp. TEM]MDQ0356275.1 hypothetical protein [Rhodoplanes tepidamans]
MARLISGQEIVDGWHPLDGVPAPEFVPDQWTGPHVGLRLWEAFEVLRRMPMPRGPREFGRAWPAYRVEWADLLAEQEGAQQAAQLREKQRVAKVLPTAEEVSRMERAISWPARFLATDRRLLLAVQRAALAFSVGRDFEWIAHTWGGSAAVWQQRDWQGCDVIADGLIAAGDLVF